MSDLKCRNLGSRGTGGFRIGGKTFTLTFESSGSSNLLSVRPRLPSHRVDELIQLVVPVFDLCFRQLFPVELKAQY
jgi:hypothetical protein